MNKTRKAIALALSFTLVGVSAISASAETQWERNHPRRDQVNDRLANQNRRINQEVREGEISRSQARQLHREDRAIRGEERMMAKFNNGHITPAEQTVGTGDVVMRVHNDAPVTHEFVVVRTDLPADGLPIGPDGLSVNEEWLSAMGELDEVPATKISSLALNLPPGRYVFFCNLEGHYLGGMHAVLEVTG